WTGVSELEGMDHLPTTSFLETVQGGWVSPRKVRDVFGEGPVSVLQERSASIPSELPFPLLLWDHPVLQQLGFQTREESSAVRKAYWREEGRKKWLDRYEPATPHGWAEN